MNRTIVNQNTLTRAQQLLRWATVYQSKVGRKVEGAALPLFVGDLDPYLTQCRLGRGVPPYQVSC